MASSWGSVIASVLGMMIYSFLYIQRWKSSGGIGRKYFLILDGTLLIYFTIRLIGLLLWFYGIIGGLDQRLIQRYNVWLLLIPGTTIIILRWWIRRKQRSERVVV